METVNLEHIKETTLGDDEFMAELIDIYLGDAAPQIELLRAAVAQADIATASSVAHRLKGSSGNVGAESLSALCGQIERASRQSRVHEVSLMLPRVEEEFSRVQACLGRIRNGSR
jgi:HPt (histidine-containing phosphotransfer) domain-containing protein